MSNRNQNTQNPNPNGANGENGAAPDNGGKQEGKKTVMSRLIHVKDKIQASKAGRIGIRIVKGLGVGGIAYFSYKAGARSVKPTTVYIQSGVTEDDEPETEPTETPEPENEMEEE